MASTSTPSSADVLIAAHVGMPHEPSGVVTLRRVEELGQEYDKTRRRWPVTVRYTCKALERPAGGTRLAEIVDIAEGMVEAEKAAKRLTLLVNVTQTGRPIIGLMTERKMRPIPIVTTESDAVRRGRGSIHCPTKELIAQLSIVLGEGRLQVQKGLEHAQTLVREMQMFRTAKAPRTTDPLANARPEENALVLAVALAAWWGDTRLHSLLRQPPAPRDPIDWGRPPTFDEAFKASRRHRALSRERRI